MTANARQYDAARRWADRWARWDAEQEEARDEARQTWLGGNR